MKTHPETTDGRATWVQLARAMALAVAGIVLTSCAGISELGAGATYDHRTGALGGQVTIKLAPPSGLLK